MFLVSYLFLAVLVFLMNTIPVLMPPTWTVLAFFVYKYNLILLPVVLIGATAATLGRIILANLSDKYFRLILPKKSQQNYLNIGEYLNSHQNLTVPLVITYAFLPIPSNDVFIAAGLAKVNIKLLALSFFVGRLISYTFWVSLTQKFGDDLAALFSRHYSKGWPIILEIAGLVILYLIGKVSWKKILNLHKNPS